jgi:hypothetical protein
MLPVVRSNMRWIVRAIVFAAACSLGIIATWYVASPYLWSSRAIFGEVHVANSSNVKIVYTGSSIDRSMRPQSEFTIYNESDEWLRYDAEYFTKVYFYPDVSTPVADCGVSIEAGDIPPHGTGRALLFQGGGCSKLSRRLANDQQVTIAIPLTPASKKSPQPFNSEPFFLTDEIHAP